MGHVARLVFLGITIWMGIIVPSEADTGALALPAAATCVPADQCCMICDKGQACGNSCISRAKTCHKGRGCACNRSEVCPAN
jgi:hypothetical protein